MSEEKTLIEPVQNKRKTDASVELLRIIACLIVIGTHTKLTATTLADGSVNRSILLNCAAGAHLYYSYTILLAKCNNLSIGIAGELLYTILSICWVFLISFAIILVYDILKKGFFIIGNKYIH